MQPSRRSRRGVGAGLAWLFLLAWTHCARSDREPVFKPAPSAPVNLCLIAGPPECFLNPTSGQQIQEGELLTVPQATQRLSGLSLDFIKAIFVDILQWDVRVRYTTGFSKTLYQTRVGDGCNVTISNIFKSSRRDTCNPSCLLPANVLSLGPEGFEPYTCCLDYSHTYFTGGWALMSKVQSGLEINYFDVFFQRDIVHAICVGVIVAFCMAHLIWVFERTVYGMRQGIPIHYQFRPKYLDGLKDGTWYAGATALGDTGSGNKLPLTPCGRVLAVLWCMFGVFLLSFVTSVISSTLTQNRLQDNEILTVQDVAGKRVCMQTGFYEYVFESSFPAVGIQKTTYEIKADCYKALKEDSVDAVFGVREELVSYFSISGGDGLLISPVVKAQEYAYAFPDSWEYGPEVNAAILMYREAAVPATPTYAESITNWYSGDATQATYGGTANNAADKWNWTLIGLAVSCVLVYMLLQIFVMAMGWVISKEIITAHGESPSKTTPGRKSGGSASMKQAMSFAANVASKLSALEEHGVNDSAVDMARVMSGRVSGRSFQGAGGTSGKIHPDESVRMSDAVLKAVEELALEVQKARVVQQQLLSAGGMMMHDGDVQVLDATGVTPKDAVAHLATPITKHVSGKGRASDGHLPV